MRHPWFARTDWLEKAALQYMAATEGAIEITAIVDGDDGPEVSVKFMGEYTEDELDGIEGVRRMERRAKELFGKNTPDGYHSILIGKQSWVLHMQLGRVTILMGSRKQDGQWINSEIVIPTNGFKAYSEVEMALDPDGFIEALRGALGKGIGMGDVPDFGIRELKEGFAIELPIGTIEME